MNERGGVLRNSKTIGNDHSSARFRDLSMPKKMVTISEKVDFLGKNNPARAS